MDSEKTETKETSSVTNSILRNSIITGIISSILFTFLIQPITNLGWLFFKNGGSQFYTELNNRLYAAAALGYRYDVERISFALVGGLFWGGSLALLLILSFGKRWWSFVDNVYQNQNIRNFTKKKSWIWISGLLKAGAIAIWVYIVFNIFLAFSFILASTELRASFDQQFNAVAPFISEQEEENLLSSWALMKSESDYRQINEQMEKYARENNIVLPPSLWKEVYWKLWVWP